MKNITFRPKNWYEKQLERDMGIHKIKSKTDAIHWQAKEKERLRLENEKLRSQINDGHELAVNSESEVKVKEEVPCKWGTLIEEGLVYCENPSDYKKKQLPRNRKIPLPVCLNCHSRIEYIRKKKEDKKRIDNNSEKDAESESKTALKVKHRSSKDFDPREDLGVCVNPILVTQTDAFKCIICKKFAFEKWRSCQAIQKTLKTNSIERRKFFEAHIERIKHPSPMEEITGRSRKMSIQQIETAFSLRVSNPHPSKEDIRFDAVNKRFHEVCEDCKELRSHRCTHYCNEFLGGLSDAPSIQE